MIFATICFAMLICCTHSFMPAVVSVLIRRNSIKCSSSTQRLERIISNRGIGSRSEVSKLLKQGRISVNGKIVKNGTLFLWIYFLNYKINSFLGAEKYAIDVAVEIDGKLSLDVSIVCYICFSMMIDSFLHSHQS